MTNLGQLGEQFVCSYLQSQGWKILHQRWRCRLGEIDIIALAASVIFVEVKTRSLSNWDQNGLLTINLQKQAKIWGTALSFLAEFPEWSEYPCRFDVALVSGQKIDSAVSCFQALPKEIELHQTICWQGYELTLIEYLMAAFEVSS